MIKKSESKGGIYFLDFKFNPELRTLQHNEIFFQLRKKQSEVLALLCEKYPEPVLYADFLDEIWCGSYVTLQSIAQTIRSLRVCMGDDTKSIITTIPKLGYRLGTRPHRVIPSEKQSWRYAKVSLWDRPYPLKFNAHFLSAKGSR